MQISFLSKTKLQAKAGSHTVISDQPKSASGTDEGMDPVNLFLAGYGCCVAIFISGLLSRRNVDLSKCGIRLEKTMADNPRRISGINVEIELPDDLSDSDKRAILKAAGMCTIHNTLHSNPQITIGLKE